MQLADKKKQEQFVRMLLLPSMKGSIDYKYWQMLVLGNHKHQQIGMHTMEALHLKTSAGARMADKGDDGCPCLRFWVYPNQPVH